MKILVVCGAGASSTFVAAKLRTAAAARGIELTAKAASADQLDALDDVDVVLVGAHLASALPSLRERAAAASTAVAVLPLVSPAALDGTEALELVLQAQTADDEHGKHRPSAIDPSQKEHTHG